MIIRSSVVELLCSCEERRTCVGFNTVSGYTPLVEVNQAIFAWSFRQPCWNISLLPPSGHKLSEVNTKNKQKSLQHPVFPGGHPSKYSQGSMLLNFSDQTRTGVFNMIWPKTWSNTCSGCHDSSGVSSLLKKELYGCWDIQTSLGYTPQVEVNQALFAWSFRQLWKELLAQRSS